MSSQWGLSAGGDDHDNENVRVNVLNGTIGAEVPTLLSQIVALVLALEERYLADKAKGKRHNAKANVEVGSLSLERRFVIFTSR